MVTSATGRAKAEERKRGKESKKEAGVAEEQGAGTGCREVQGENEALGCRVLPLPRPGGWSRRQGETPEEARAVWLNVRGMGISSNGMVRKAHGNQIVHSPAPRPKGCCLDGPGLLYGYPFNHKDPHTETGLRQKENEQGGHERPT